MPSDRLFIIHNPFAGSLLRSDKQAGSRGLLADIRKTLSGRHEWVETRTPEDARNLARHAPENGYGRVVAVGGDGTVHEVINGLMALPQSARPVLGILPIGSGNDFAFAAGISPDLRQALDAVLHGGSRAVDIGRMEDDLGRVEYFDNSVGIGFDAQVTIQAMKIKALRGFSRYFAATLQTIARYHTTFQVDMVIDRLRLHEDALMLTIGNGPREGGGFITTPDSIIDDGRFEMLLIKPISRPRMLALLPKVLRGTHLDSPSVYHRSFESMNLTSRDALVIHADGEIFGDAARPVHELKITIENHALRVMT